jgi:hypothetical protein
MWARRFGAAALATLVACGGGNGSGNTTDDTRSTSRPTGGGGGANCNEIPEFDLASMNDCEAVADAWYDVSGSAAAGACETDDDCHAVSSPCRENAEIGGCYVITNKCVTEGLSGEYSSTSTNLNCVEVDGIRVNACECDSPPPPVACINGECGEPAPS